MFVYYFKANIVLQLILIELNVSSVMQSTSHMIITSKAFNSYVKRSPQKEIVIEISLRYTIAFSQIS